jgi:hypothetical protein
MGPSALPSGRKQDFITLYRQQVTNILNALAASDFLEGEFVALNFAVVLQDTDFAGPHQGLTKQDLINARNALQAIKVVIATGQNAQYLFMLKQ